MDMGFFIKFAEVMNVDVFMHLVIVNNKDISFQCCPAKSLCTDNVL